MTGSLSNFIVLNLTILDISEVPKYPSPLKVGDQYNTLLCSTDDMNVVEHLDITTLFENLIQILRKHHGILSKRVRLKHKS